MIGEEFDSDFITIFYFLYKFKESFVFTFGFIKVVHRNGRTLDKLIERECLRREVTKSFHTKTAN